MLFNIFNLSIKISKRQYSNNEIEKAYEMSKTEESMNKCRTEYLQQHRARLM